MKLRNTENMFALLTALHIFWFRIYIFFRSNFIKIGIYRDKSQKKQLNLRTIKKERKSDENKKRKNGKKGMEKERDKQTNNG